MSCWQPVSIGAVIVNDDGAISIMPFGAPAMKEYPKMIMSKVVVLVLLGLIIPIVVTLVGIVTDVSAVP